MGDRSRTRFRTHTVEDTRIVRPQGWSLVQKSAGRAGCIRGAHVLRGRNLFGVRGAFDSHLVCHSAQARWKSARVILRSRVDRSLFSDGNRRLECVARWRRLGWSHTGNHDLSDSTRTERGMVHDLFWTVLAGLGADRNYPALGRGPRHDGSVLSHFRFFRHAHRALPRMDHLRSVLECRNLALEFPAHQSKLKTLRRTADYFCNRR
jgi:hypothetical protein